MAHPEYVQGTLDGLLDADAPAGAEQSLRETTFVVVDLETTGGAPDGGGITEIGAVKIRGGEELGVLATLVNPGEPIPPFITVLTGITQAMLTPAPPIEVVLTTLLNDLSSRGLGDRGWGLGDSEILIPNPYPPSPIPYILVLDDYHAIDAPAIHQALALLVPALIWLSNKPQPIPEQTRWYTKLRRFIPAGVARIAFVIGSAPQWMMEIR